MSDALSAGRLHFAFTIMFHYLFPVLTMGLSVLIVILKTKHLRTGNPDYGNAARFWMRIFAISFAAGVVTGIPMEFQFGTNWSEFSRFAGGVVGQTLFMEGAFAFFAESTFLGLFLFGEKRLSPKAHWFSALMVALGANVSGFFICATDAWMQNPVGYKVTMVNGEPRAELTSLWALVSNPYAWAQFVHAICGSLVTASMVVAGVGAYYVLTKRHETVGRISVRLGVVCSLIFSVLQLAPTGHINAVNVGRMQPAKMAAAEGIFETTSRAPMALFGIPDVGNNRLTDAIVVPGALSLLLHNSLSAEVKGLNEFDKSEQPPVEVVFHAYHIMVALGMIFIGVSLLAAFLLWRGTLFNSRLMMWLLMLVIPLPYIANQAGWVVTEVGRQPWAVYGVMKTAEGVSPNVTSGMTWFTLLGFAGLYTILLFLYLYLFVRIVAQGPGEADGSPAPKEVA